MQNVVIFGTPEPVFMLKMGARELQARYTTVATLIRITDKELRELRQLAIGCTVRVGTWEVRRHA